MLDQSLTLLEQCGRRSIPHNKLMEKIGKKISDGRVLKLIESYLKAGVMETGKGGGNSRGDPARRSDQPAISQYLPE